MYTVYNNEYGIDERPYYYIQEQRKFLWWTFWHNITESVCDYGGCSQVVKAFSSEYKAKDYITNDLCKRRKPKGWSNTMVDEVGCRG